MNVTPNNFRIPSYFEVLVYGWPAKGRARGPNTYPLHVLDAQYQLLPLPEARGAVDQFVLHAIAHPSQHFMVTRLGPNPNDIAPLFIPVGRKSLPHNIYLPQDYWWVIDRIKPTPRRPSESAKSAYVTYLRSPHWQELKGKVYERWGKFCLNCSSDTEIDAHHIRYRANLEDCTTDDVVPLCRRCHEHYHAVKWGDPDLLKPITDAPDPGQMVAALRSFFGTTRHRPHPVTSVELNRVRLHPQAAHTRRWMPYAPQPSRKAVAI